LISLDDGYNILVKDFYQSLELLKINRESYTAFSKNLIPVLSDKGFASLDIYQLMVLKSIKCYSLQGK